MKTADNVIEWWNVDGWQTRLAWLLPANDWLILDV